MIHPLYERLSDEEWEAAWPSSGPRVKGKSAAERAQEFGIDLTLVKESLELSVMERLHRAQEAASFLLRLQQEALKGQPDSSKSRK